MPNNSVDKTIEYYSNGFTSESGQRRELDKVGFSKSIYEYLKSYRKKRGVGVITDSQCIFYVQFLDRYCTKTHDEISANIEDIIHEENKGYSNVYDNHLYIFAIASYFYISFPNDGTLSMNQYKYLCDILDQVDRYNKETEQNYGKPIHIDFFYGTKLQNAFAEKFKKEQNNASMKQELKKLVTPNIELENEMIIGKTLSEEEKTESILFHIGLKDNMTIDEITLMLKMCNQYFKNENSRHVFLKLFPNYEEISKLIEVLYYLEKKEIGLLRNIVFKNMNDILKNSDVIKNQIRNIFNSNMDYYQIKNIFISIKEINNNKLVNELFPHFDLIYNLINGVYLNEHDIEIINSLLAKAKTYDDKVSTLVNFFYQKINNDICTVEDEIQNTKKYFEYISVGKRIIKNKELLNSLIERYNSLSTCLSTTNSSILTAEYKIVIKGNEATNYNEKISKYSSNFLRKILNRRKLKEYKTRLTTINDSLEILESQRREAITEKESINQELKEIERQFKEITEFDYMVYNTSDMEFYYNRDFTIDEKLYEESIKRKQQQLDNLRNSLTLLEHSNLIAVNENNLKRQS